MRILYVSQYFPPEMGAPSARAHDLARIWAEAGHEVTVLTGFPNHPTGVLDAGYRRKFWRFSVRETLERVEVVRTWLIPLPNRKAHERILNYSSFCVSAALRGLTLKKFDIVVATSPQLLVGLSGLIISRLRGSKFVFEVRDLWPESLIATGVSHDRSWIYRSLRRLSKMLYRQCDHMVVVTPAFKRHIVSEFECAPEKVSVVPNGVDLDWIGEARSRYVPARNGKFVVSFIGTIGHAHGVDTILQTAAILRQRDPSILFRIIGEGAERDKIESAIRAQKLDNVEILRQQPRPEIPARLWDSDVCLVLLKRSEVFKTVIPTKMLECMAAGRPVILGVEGQALEILTEANAGLAITPESAEELATAVLRLKYDPGLTRECGRSGEAYIRAKLSRRGTALEYERLLLSLTRQEAAAKVQAKAAGAQ